MKGKKYDIDGLLKQALHSTETPDAALVQRVKSYSNKEDYTVNKKTFRFSFSAVAAVITIMMLATTAFAAWYLLKPSDIAEKNNDYALSAAFRSDTAININKSVTSGDYIFSLLAVVSGKDITDMPYYKDGVEEGRTYAVLAIQNADGTPMPNTMDSNYGDVSFFASPLIKGFKPWQVNAVTLNGGYSETVVDGIMYRLVECDNVSVFADRGLYFSVCDKAFINNEPFSFNEQTGEITVNPDYKGVSALFDLPIDKKYADPVKAQEYLDMIGDMFSDKTDSSDTNTDNTIPNAELGTPLTLEPSGYSSKQVMTYATLKAWTEKQLIEKQIKVDRGEYSKSLMELDRRDYEEMLADIENGLTVTLYTHEDGSYSFGTANP